MKTNGFKAKEPGPCGSTVRQCEITSEPILQWLLDYPHLLSVVKRTYRRIAYYVVVKSHVTSKSYRSQNSL